MVYAYEFVRSSFAEGRLSHVSSDSSRHSLPTVRLSSTSISINPKRMFVNDNNDVHRHFTVATRRSTLSIPHISSTPLSTHHLIVSCASRRRTLRYSPRVPPLHPSTPALARRCDTSCAPTAAPTLASSSLNVPSHAAQTLLVIFVVSTTFGALRLVLPSHFRRLFPSRTGRRDYEPICAGQEFCGAGRT